MAAQIMEQAESLHLEVFLGESCSDLVGGELSS